MKDILSTAKLLVSKRMLILIPCMIWTAISVAIFSGTFIVIMTESMKVSFPDWTHNKINMYALFAMVSIGVGEIVGSFIQGYIIDKKGSKFSILPLLVLTAISITILLYETYASDFSFFTFVMTLFWGF